MFEQARWAAPCSAQCCFPCRCLPALPTRPPATAPACLLISLLAFLPVQPQEFIDCVQRDRLASLFSLLERRAPGHRPYLLVLGLEGHIRRSEGKQYKADMRAVGASQVCSAVRWWELWLGWVCGRFLGV